MAEPFVPVIPPAVLALPEGVKGVVWPTTGHLKVWNHGTFPKQFCGEPTCCLALDHVGPHVWWDGDTAKWWTAPGHELMNSKAPLTQVKQLKCYQGSR